MHYYLLQYATAPVFTLLFSQDIPPLIRNEIGMSPEMLKLQILWMKKKALTFLRSAGDFPQTFWGLLLWYEGTSQP